MYEQKEYNETINKYNHSKEAYNSFDKMRYISTLPKGEIVSIKGFLNFLDKENKRKQSL